MNKSESFLLDSYPEETYFELLQKYLKETRPDLSQKARDELVEQSINKQTQK